MGGATGPITLAGTVTLHNAELLAALFVVQALSQHFPSDIYNSGPHSIDPVSMLCSFGSPNQALFGICMAQLGRYYRIKCVANVGLSDALIPDFQCGIEKAVTAAYSVMAGIQTLGCQGIVGSDQGFSFEQIVLDNEWLGYCNYILRGVEVTEETIAADLIESIGIAGNFLEEEHTALHLRESFFKSHLFRRQGWDAWISGGAKDVLDRAHELVEQMTQHYQDALPVCTPAEWDELCRIVATANSEARR
jgi:trimethylamine--corrinoid protein Co-methyltransferase